MGILEKIGEIEKEIARTQKNKGLIDVCKKFPLSLSYPLIQHYQLEQI